MMKDVKGGLLQNQNKVSDILTITNVPLFISILSSKLHNKWMKVCFLNIKKL